MDKVNTLEAARDWFLENHFGSVLCISGPIIRACNSFKEAEEFYKLAEGNTDD